MDGRLFLKLSGLLLSAAAGCQHTVTNLPSSSPINPPPVDVKEAKNTPPKELPPMVLVSSGDFKAGEAMIADVPPERRQFIRERARQDYEKALKLDRKCLPAYLGLARLSTITQDHERAAEIYQQALRLAPNNAVVWYELGMSHNYRKNWGPAVECLSKAVHLDPANRAYVTAQAVVLAEAGQYDESLNCFVRSSGEAMGYYRMAQTLHRLQQPDLSQRYFALAMQKDPNLGTTLALQSGDNINPNLAAPQVRQTAYQAPSDSAPQTAVAPAAPAESVPAPQTVVAPAPLAESVSAPQTAVAPAPLATGVASPQVPVDAAADTLPQEPPTAANLPAPQQFIPPPTPPINVPD